MVGLVSRLTCLALSSYEDGNTSPRHSSGQVTDFGLSCEGTVNYGSDSMPTRWVPLEVLRRDRWSVKSDVWAFGVTMWELLAYGLRPYEDLKDAEVKQFIMAGNRLDHPNAPSSEEDVKFWEMIQSCWAQHPRDRPDFETLLSKLSKK